MSEKIKHRIDVYRIVTKFFFKWLVIALLVGAVVGAVGSAFAILLTHISEFRAHNHYLTYLLPLGIVIVFLYKLLKYDDKGTNIVISNVQEKGEVSFKVAPLMFISTAITQLFGGSSGREGAALQIGGGIASGIGKLFKMDVHDKHMIVMCGMSAGFSSVFGTPLAAAFFAIEVATVGHFSHAPLVPCVVSSITAWVISIFLHTEREVFTVTSFSEVTVLNLFKIAVIAALCAIMAVIFCILLSKGGALIKKTFKNPYIRILACSGLLILIYELEGSDMFSGAGNHLIFEALKGNAKIYSPLLKMIVTVITLKGGFKGGEIVPSFAIGATFGCLMGQLFGLSPSMCAAICMVAFFSAATNCPITALVLGFELFGFEGAVFFALAIVIAVYASGFYSLYSSQLVALSAYEIDEKEEKIHTVH